jgi:cellulose synthase/poly-beta-1,6-N-acetylglucosamine synthase-like glycosyltransferase
MDELISVIVPVYNVEMYIRECLESLVHQTHENIEILRSERHAAKVKAAMYRRGTNFDSPDSSYCSTKHEMPSKYPFPSFGVETCGQTRSHCDCVRCIKHKCHYIRIKETSRIEQLRKRHKHTKIICLTLKYSDTFKMLTP